MRRSRRHGDRESGQILVLFELVLVIILACAALVIDLGVLRNNKQILVNTFDAAALAGGSVLPVDGSVVGAAAGANTIINNNIQANYPSLPKSATSSGSRCVVGVDASIGSCGYRISYACLVGVDSSGNARLSDLPYVCDPHNALGHSSYTQVLASDFAGAGPTRYVQCNPSAGDKCNVVVISGSATTQYVLAPVVGVSSGSTGTVVSVACNGPCGASPVIPVDLVIIVDRTASMSAADVGNVQTGANAVLSVYDPAFQRVALGTIGPSQVSDSATGRNPLLVSCPTSSNGYIANHAIGTVYGVGQSPANSVDYFGPAPTDLGRWVPAKFSGTDPASPPVTFNEQYSTYNPATPDTRTVNTSSTLAKAISCVVSYTQGTNLDTPVREAGYYLQTYGRSGVTKGIILETDGTPQAGNGSAHYTCDQANAAATAVKASGIVMYTIGYGVSGATCPTTSGGTNQNSNETATWSGKPTTTLLASMASPATPASPMVKFFNSPASSAVAAAFRSAALDLAGHGAHLIQLYPAPVVKGVAPATGAKTGGNTVTISGEYFTGATSVHFGGAVATFHFVSDASITATAPPGAANQTVDITVSGPGGISAIVTVDHYTYGP